MIDYKEEDKPAPVDVLSQAIQSYIASQYDDSGESPKFVSHWVLVAGITDFSDNAHSTFHLVNQPSQPDYITSGLLTSAQVVANQGWYPSNAGESDE